MIQYLRLLFSQPQFFRDAASLFVNLQEELNFIRLHDLRTAHKAVLKLANQHEAAAELHLIDGEFKEASVTFIGSGSSSGSRRAALALLDGLWVQSFGHELPSNGKALVEDLQAIKGQNFEMKIRDEVKSAFAGVLN